MGPDDGGSGQCFAAQRADSFNVEGSRWDLSKVKDATEKTGFLIIIFSRSSRLEPQVRAEGNRQPSWLFFRPMMMQHTRKDVDHQVSGQRGGGNQWMAQGILHRNIRQNLLKTFSSSSERNSQRHGYY
jgi:hypothetical protein